MRYNFRAPSANVTRDDDNDVSKGSNDAILIVKYRARSHWTLLVDDHHATCCLAPPVARGANHDITVPSSNPLFNRALQTINAVQNFKQLGHSGDTLCLEM
jgi:hypothetical protein